ncbi:MAG: hypothetical protein ACRCST_10925 [Turicibacter sp.]
MGDTMKKKVRKKVIIRLGFLCLIPFSIISIAVTALASNTNETPTVLLIQEDRTPRISEIILPINAPIVEEIEEQIFILSRTSNIDETIELSATESFSFAFNFSETTPSDRTRFTTSISHIKPNTNYTVIITYNGIEIYNQQHSGPIVLETMNCQQDQDFRVYLINTTSKPFKARISISNYLEI